MFNKQIVMPVAASSVVLSLSLTPAAQALTPDSFFDIWIDAVDTGQAMKEVDASTPKLYTGYFDTEMLSMSLSGSPSAPPPVVTDLGGGRYTVDSFFDITYRLSPPGSSSFTVDSFFDIAYRIGFVLDATRSTDDGAYFDTEILAMDLAGATPSPTNSSQIRLAQGVEHRGHVTVLKLAGPGGGGGGGFQVDSFFDIFYEISLDGGNNWSSSPTGLTHFESVQVVPEPASAMLLVLGTLAIARRRRHAQVAYTTWRDHSSSSPPRPLALALFC